MSSHEESHAHEPTWLTPILVFVALGFFTFLTVALAGIDVSAMTALAISVGSSTIKATLVVAFFMHLKYEKITFTVFLGITIGTLFVIAALTYADYGFRW